MAVKKRTYQSPARQRQADETRSRITAAARKLLETHGYSGMTMEAVAQEAGVAAPTVYAVFGSKTGILAAVLDAARFSDSFYELVREALQTPDPRERLKFAARISRRVYESEGSVLDLLRGAAVVSPELAQSEQERECSRYEGQRGLIEFLVLSGRLRAGLTEDKARDILWSLTSRDLYRMMVKERGWPAEEYESWLANTIAEVLVAPAQG